MKKIKRVFLIVLDSLGVGAAPDAADFGDFVFCRAVTGRILRKIQEKPYRTAGDRFFFDCIFERRHIDSFSVKKIESMQFRPSPRFGDERIVVP